MRIFCCAISASFNPRSREGSDLGSREAASSFGVSIHAPVKGATEKPPAARARQSRFNPRSREGSDQALPIPSQAETWFQSTLP